MKAPKNLDMGFGELVEVSYLEQLFGISRRTALKYLKVFKIKPLYFGKDIYFSLPTFKRILFVLSKPGAKGFVAPGSPAKNNPRICKNPDYLFEVDDEILSEAASPKIAAEMLACDGRNIDIIKKFASKSVGRPRKEPDERTT
jgi:hypothetical protein